MSDVTLSYSPPADDAVVLWDGRRSSASGTRYLSAVEEIPQAPPSPYERGAYHGIKRRIKSEVVQTRRSGFGHKVADFLEQKQQQAAAERAERGE